MKKIKINNFEENLYYKEMSNGLKVYVVPMKNKENFCSMIVTKYGGRDIKFTIDGKEYTTPSGIAHFLEHKMFEREDDPFKFYGRYGTDVNAATSDDYTCYYFIGNKCFKKSLSYLLNWIQKLDVTDEQVQKEKGIILEEASMYKDNPSRVMYNKIKENVFINDPKRNKVIGTDNDIKSITKKDLVLCFDSFYNLNNMYLIITGNVRPSEVFETIEKETSNVPKNSIKGVPIYNNEPNEVSKAYEEIFMNIGVPKISVSYKINKNCFDSLKLNKFELDLYLHFLINISLGVTSEIRQKWIEEELFTDAFYRISEIESHYVIEFHVNSNKDEDLLEALEAYINNLVVDEDSFEREKKIWIANEIRAIENPLSTLYNILDDLLDYNEFIPNKIECIKKLNFQTLLELKELLHFSNKAIIKIMPLHLKKKI